MWVQQWWWWWWGDSAQLALLLLRSVSSYVEYSDCCLCASSIGGSTTAQNRFRCWCWCAEDREPASQPARSSLARDSTLTDCCCSVLPSLRLLFFSAFFFLSSPPNSSWGTAIAVAVVVAELYVFLRTGSSSSTFPVVFSSSACAPLFESRCLPSFLPFLLCTYNALSPLSLSLLFPIDESKCSCRRRVRRTGLLLLLLLLLLLCSLTAHCLPRPERAKFRKHSLLNAAASAGTHTLATAAFTSASRRHYLHRARRTTPHSSTTEAVLARGARAASAAFSSTTVPSIPLTWTSPTWQMLTGEDGGDGDDDGSAGAAGGEENRREERRVECTQQRSLEGSSIINGGGSA